MGEVGCDNVIVGVDMVANDFERLGENGGENEEVDIDC